MLDALFTPLRAGDLALAHRVVMAPLTRMRAEAGNVPGPLAATYYGQRASEGGLIVSEATQVDATGQGYPSTPGLHTDAQVAGWRRVTDAVHARGGLIVAQLWHVGRVSHSSFQPAGGAPVGASAVPMAGRAFTAAGELVEPEVPRPLDAAEIPDVVAMYRRGAELAEQANFDGVEVHGANGYLLDQFLQDGSNRRDDAYGGPVERRARLLIEAVDAARAVWGSGRVGVRLSPYGTANDVRDSDPVAVFTHAIRELSARGLAYLHLIEPRATGAGVSDAVNADAPHASGLFRRAFGGALVSAGGYDGPSAAAAVASGAADAVAFGRLFIANPDLPERLRRGLPLNAYDRATFYGGAERGYTDYPAHEAAAAGVAPVGA